MNQDKLEGVGLEKGIKLVCGDLICVIMPMSRKS
jgi:hypothetical protein